MSEKAKKINAIKRACGVVSGSREVDKFLKDMEKRHNIKAELAKSETEKEREIRKAESAARAREFIRRNWKGCGTRTECIIKS